MFDFVPVPAGSMRIAIVTAADIYRFAGVQSEWPVCVPAKEPPVPYHMPAEGAPLQVKVLAPRMGTGQTSRAAFGYAVLPEDCHAAFLAYAFYARIAATARSRDLDPGLLLGIVIAHEVGHLLGLPESNGVMHSAFTREDLQRAQVGLLRFSDVDAGRLRALFAR